MTTFFAVISTKTLSVPPGHSKIFPAHIPNCKVSPIQICALFEPKDKFEQNNQVSAPNVFFDLTEEVIPIAINNKTEEKSQSTKTRHSGFPKFYQMLW